MRRDNMNDLSAVTPVLLAGGIGRRLYPLSTSQKPKSFIRPFGGLSFLQSALERGRGMSAPVIVCNKAHYDRARQQARQSGYEDVRYILEPARRNTGPAIIAAASVLQAEDWLLLVMPTDHIIPDIDIFHDAVRAAIPSAREGHIVTFGIKPDRPETSFGYIRQGRTLDDRVYTVEDFTEKPDKAAVFPVNMRWEDMGTWGSYMCLDFLEQFTQQATCRAAAI